MLIHADLFVTDMERSLDFYVRKLGYQIAEDVVVHGDLPRFVSFGHHVAMRIVILSVSRVGAGIELLAFIGPPREGELFLPPHHGSLTLGVSDLDAQIARLRAVRVEPVSPVFEVAPPKAARSRIVFYRDPDGHMLEFIETPAGPRSRPTPRQASRPCPAAHRP